MKLSKKDLDALIAERRALNERLTAIAAAITAHFSAVADERRVKRKPRGAPKSPISNPDVQVVRDYVRKHVPGAQVFNNRRSADRRVKIWYGLSPVVLAKHKAALAELLPQATFVETSPEYGRGNVSGKRCLCVILPL